MTVKSLTTLRGCVWVGGSGCVCAKKVEEEKEVVVEGGERNQENEEDQEKEKVDEE